MINHQATLLALRGRALTLSVCTTGSLTGILSATPTGYARTSGSFLADGFTVGMEVTPTGFASLTPGVVTAVSALSLGISGGRTAETPAGACAIAVGLPANRSWTNVDLTPTAGRWWVQEDYLPGPAEQTTLGPNGQIESLPQYVLTLFGTENTGAAALAAMADALLALFAPRTTLVASTGDLVAVRTSPAPYRGQLLPAEGWVMVSVTIPCRVRSPNSI